MCYGITIDLKSGGISGNTGKERALQEIDGALVEGEEREVAESPKLWSTTMASSWVRSKRVGGMRPRMKKR